MNIKHFYQKIRTYVAIVSKDLEDHFTLPILKKIIYWKRGFLAEKYILYRLYENDYRDYLSDYHASMARNINDPFNDVLVNKYIFSEFVSKYFRVPIIYGYVLNGIYYPYKKDYSIEKIINHYDYLVIKSITGGGGNNVFILQKKDGQYIINNKASISAKELENFLKGFNNFIIVEYMYPGSFSKRLNKYTINTMRVVTMIDPETKKPFIARAVQRIGVRSSEPMDNFTKGGLSASIDLETGALGDATAHPKTTIHKRYIEHPDNNLEFKGLIIPNWDNIKEEILYGAMKLNILKCVGWDFLLTDDGLVAIEGNHHPDPDVLQGHGPLLNDKKIRAFYKYYNII